MRATFTADVPNAEVKRDPHAVFQTVMADKVYPVVQQIVSTARASTRHQGVAQAYQPGLNATGNKVTAYVTNDHPLFRIIEGGSKPHVIRAKNKPYLVFMGNRGHLVSVREVAHPGTKPMRPLANAFKQHNSDVDRAIGEGVKEWLAQSLGGA